MPDPEEFELFPGSEEDPNRGFEDGVITTATEGGPQNPFGNVDPDEFREDMKQLCNIDD